MKRRRAAHASLGTNLGSLVRGRGSAEPGDLGALQLAAEVRRRFQVPPGGGRATDPSWTSKRLIPMRPGTLARLQELAAEVSRHVKGRVEPLQIAALLIECHLPPGSHVAGNHRSSRDLGTVRGKAMREANLEGRGQRRMDAGAMRQGRVIP